MSEPPAAKRIKLELETKLNYRNGLFLAPMVRCGTLPTRLLSLDYGASLVWGPEIVDRAIIGAERVVDDRTGTISFVKNKRSVFECHPIEKSRLIYQIGSSDPELALKAAKLVEQDVSGIDLNCGCPKDFSLKGGMGAALLKEPEKLCSILRNLVANLGVPVSCKIRLLPEQDATLSLVRQIAGTGISNLTVHCRTQTMRDREPALLHRLREIVDLVTAEFGIPVVANGDCFGTKDRERICALTGVTSIMIARGAEANPSCFLQTSELLDPMTVILPRYVRVALAVGNPFHNSKYCLGAMDLSASTASASHVPGVREKRKALKQELVRAKTYRDFAAALNLAETDEEHALLEQATLDEVLPALKGKLRVQDGEMEEQTEEELRHATRAEKEVCSGKEVVEDKENEAPGAEANASAKPSCASGGSVDASMSSSTSSPETAGVQASAL